MYILGLFLNIVGIAMLFKLIGFNNVKKHTDVLGGMLLLAGFLMIFIPALNILSGMGLIATAMFIKNDMKKHK